MCPKPALIRSITQLGFTLVELVVGIVVMAVAFTILTTLLVTQSRESIDPLHQMRAAELGQSILNEIVSRSYDQYSDHNGGLYRCGEIWWQGDANVSGSSWFDQANQGWVAWDADPNAQIVLCSTSLGPETGEVRGGGENTFNDVDDYITPYVNAVSFGDALGQPLNGVYQNFQLKIDVVRDPSFGGGADTAKRIDLTILTPSGNEQLFSAYRGNY
ncbi:type II secretion system GspH family protein [Motilimonas cestriensis]|uniref:Type II secretion system GspH family protein n=1 Tax=Motilimonas cestriensis TaxID=2742685 RepID=A0ABS8WCJ0_9GAMM|nr:type II secretion system protein [Motilimonas cestriensis]MCE2596042.1 type II secretion system GspH family protein [Motilimonas cestriensis]